MHSRKGRAPCRNGDHNVIDRTECCRTLAPSNAPLSPPLKASSPGLRRRILRLPHRALPWCQGRWQLRRRRKPHRSFCDAVRTRATSHWQGSAIAAAARARGCLSRIVEGVRKGLGSHDLPPQPPSSCSATQPERTTDDRRALTRPSRACASLLRRRGISARPECCDRARTVHCCKYRASVAPAHAEDAAHYPIPARADLRRRSRCAAALLCVAGLQFPSHTQGLASGIWTHRATDFAADSLRLRNCQH